jgi:hypothetical protein
MLYRGDASTIDMGLFPTILDGLSSQRGISFRFLLLDSRSRFRPDFLQDRQSSRIASPTTHREGVDGLRACFDDTLELPVYVSGGG